MLEFKTWEFVLIALIFAALGAVIGISIGYSIWSGNNAHLTSSYELSDWCAGHNPCNCGQIGEGKDFDAFWDEVTKHTTFTLNGEPVEITDVQIFYKQQSNIGGYVQCSVLHQFMSQFPGMKYTIEYCTDDMTLCHITTYASGNVTYYPSGAGEGQTHVASTPVPTCPCVKE